MSESYRDAKAQAKAEKARAKAMRPWWKKKRFIIPLVLGVLVIASVAGSSGGGDDDGSSSAQDNAGVNSDFSTNTKNKPADDVEVVSCEKTIIDTVEVGLKITNHSSKASDYTISLSVEDPSGAQVGDGFASARNLDPGQTANVTGVATLSGKPATFTCVLEEVERFAS